MAKMDYMSPGITKIGFEDSLFVTTELSRDENLEVKGYIESRGGVIKNSVTKTTDYLIYKDGEEETTKYKKALELIRDKGLEIKVLSLKTFSELLTMKVTPGISKIRFYGQDILPGNWLFKHLILGPDTKAGIRAYEANRSRKI